MPAALMQPVGLSTPLTPAQRPFILWVGGTDIISYVDITSYSLDDADITQPGVFTFRVIDSLNTIGNIINPLDEVIWYDSAADNMLFRGFVRQIDVDIVATYSTLTLTCTDVSEILDYAQPVISDVRPAETTKARVQYLLGTYGTISTLGVDTGNWISSGSGLPQPPIAFQRESLRTAIEKSIALEGAWSPATGTLVPYYSMDSSYQAHVFYAPNNYVPYNGPNAPYILTDGPYDRISTIPYSITVTYDATSDTDWVYVYGATGPPASGYSSNGLPRSPRRTVSVDASTAVDQPTRRAAGQAELGRRQNIVRAQAIVTGYDGWAKGQLIYVTNAILGLSLAKFFIAGVSMKALSGTGYREYTLQLNASRPRLSRIVASRVSFGPTSGSAVQGQIGGY